MTRSSDHIDSVIRESLSAALPELGDVRFDAVLTSDVGLDSVQIMDLIMEIEDRLDISISIETLAETQTLDQLSARISQQMTGTAR